MEKNIKVDLEFLLIAEELRINRLKEENEIDLGKTINVVSVNRIPFYRAGTVEENGLLLGKIQKILDKDEAIHLKEKYLI